MVAVVALLLVAADNPLVELQSIDKKLAASERQLGELEREQQTLRAEQAEAQAAQAAAKVRTQEALVAYAKRLRAMARMPAGGRLMVLGGSSSFRDYLAAKRVLHWVVRHDHALHQRYLGELEALSRLETQIAERRRRITALTEEARTTRDRAAAAREKRLLFLTQAVRSKDAVQRLTRAQGASERQLLAQLRRLVPVTSTRGFAALKGRLPWPSAGTLAVGFGQQVELAFGSVISHNGIDIAAKPGTPVQAVARGQVAFADWLVGFGQVVIIDHGEQYHTLYAHLGSVRVAVGDKVEGGTEIGTVGDTGSVLGTRLYFEVRAAGSPQDPLAWLRH